MTETKERTIYDDVFYKSIESLNKAGQVDTLTATQVDLYRTELTALYGILSEQLGELERTAGEEWLKAKLDHDCSDKVADKHCDASKNGQERIVLKLRLKSIDKMIGALKDRQYRLRQEAWQEGHRV